MSRIDNRDVLELRFQDVTSGLAGERTALALRHREDAAKTVRVTNVRSEGGEVRADLGELSLDDGTWEVLWIDRDGRHNPVATKDPGFSLAEREEYLAEPRRRELRVIRDPEGRLRLRATSVAPYAEVAWVEVGSRSVTVSGVLAYAPRNEGHTTARVLASQRERSGSVVSDAALVDGKFTCEIPLDPIVAAHDPDRAHNEWDLWLQIPTDDAGLRLGAHADDIVGKKKKVVFPSVLLDGAADTIRIRPYYTVDDELSLLATVGREGRR
ncbi:hypothetical protein F4561_004738 [Lipingzhangella halophila]|uniref:Uncharacterized protein n=1 Tax=Lipingzhangella halophila TaxID=1783352 RepID=A0A7W7RKZ7_9ACTN|nr:hypothetical protein [Lipingzhangella halophila]MBB4933918.1 hypothetical protein [Lipingzhangella halophila]